MRNLLFGVQIILFGLFSIAAIATIITLFSEKTNNTSHITPQSRIEEFDPSLNRIASIKDLISYCDSIYSTAHNGHPGKFVEGDYTEIASGVVKKRFYHGYSRYSLKNNYVAVIFSKLINEGYSAIVIPDEIMKYPNASCSQQSIVVMEVLRRRGIITRKVGFHGKSSGHFCFEVYYEGGWHYYDTNLEPDEAILNAAQRPSIKNLAAQQDILLAAYNKYPKEWVLDIFPSYFYGQVNEFPAPRGIVFQRVSKWLTYSAWLIFLSAFLYVRRKYLKLTMRKVWNHRVYFPPTEPAIPPAYYSSIPAQ
jgi:hypothetical protein